MPPSLVLRGARTAPGAGPGDLPITGDRIDGDIAGSTEVVDAGGRLVLPGLWDAHVHFDQWTLAQAALDLSGATSAAHAVALVAARLAGDPAPVVVAHGFRDRLWPDTPTAAALDAIAPARPVVAFSADLHSAWFNTAALQRFSLHPHPTGLLRETEFMPLMNEIQRVDPEVRDRLVDSAARAAAARGVVGVVDFEIADTLATWRRRIGAGTRHLRVRCGIWPRWLDAAIAAGMRTGDVVPGTAGLATVGPLKVIVDGSLGTRTAYCHDPYPDGGHGVLSVPPERLEPLMRHAHEHGVESAIHAIGDHACEHVLDAFAATGARGSVEHAQFVAERDFPRFARSGVTASIQPAHVYDDVDLAERYCPAARTAPSRTGRCTRPGRGWYWAPTRRSRPWIRGGRWPPRSTARCPTAGSGTASTNWTCRWRWPRPPVVVPASPSATSPTWWCSTRTRCPAPVRSWPRCRCGARCSADAGRTGR